MRHLFIGLSALLLAASSAIACINDREVDRSEREFKSQYLQPAPTTSDPSPPEGKGLSLAFLGGGGLLLLGATVSVIKRRKGSSPE